jgi:hypothetical protein
MYQSVRRDASVEVNLQFGLDRLFLFNMLQIIGCQFYILCRHKFVFIFRTFFSEKIGHIIRVNFEVNAEMHVGLYVICLSFSVCK